MRNVLLVISWILITVSIWLALGAAAIEPVQRNIIYVHVPASVCSMICFVPLFICSVCYLATKRQGWDITACACAEVGLVFATAMNLSGMIFAHAEWNIWWTPSPRLISAAALWFLYAAYLLLRASFANESRTPADLCGFWDYRFCGCSDCVYQRKIHTRYSPCEFQFR